MNRETATAAAGRAVHRSRPASPWPSPAADGLAAATSQDQADPAAGAAAGRPGAERQAKRGGPADARPQAPATERRNCASDPTSRPRLRHAPDVTGRRTLRHGARSAAAPRRPAPGPGHRSPAAAAAARRRPPPAPAPAAGPRAGTHPSRRPAPEQRVVSDDPRRASPLRDLRLPGRTPRRTPPWPPPSDRAEVVADVDATCSRFRADSDLTPGQPRAADAGSTSTRCWWPRSGSRATLPAHRRAGAPAAGPAPGRQLGYDRDFRAARHRADDPLRRPTPRPRRLARDRPRPRRTACASRPAPRSTSARPRRRGPPTWSRPASSTSSACRRWSASAATCGSPHPDGEPWPVAVAEHPGDVRERPTPWSDSTAGGLATSSTPVRRWTRRGAQRHHLLDPRTGRAGAEVWRTVTATGPTCVAANTASTAAVVLGDAAAGWLGEHDVTARLVAADGTRPTSAAGPPTPSGGRHDRRPVALVPQPRQRRRSLLVLLTLTVVLGVLVARRPSRPRLPRFVTQALHRNACAAGRRAARRRTSSRGRRRVRRHPLVAGVRAVRRDATSRSGWASAPVASTDRRSWSPACCGTGCAPGLAAPAPAGLADVGHRVRPRHRHGHRPARRVVAGHRRLRRRRGRRLVWRLARIARPGDPAAAVPEPDHAPRRSRR